MFNHLCLYHLQDLKCESDFCNQITFYSISSHWMGSTMLLYLYSVCFNRRELGIKDAELQGKTYPRRHLSSETFRQGEIYKNLKYLVGTHIENC